MSATKRIVVNSGFLYAKTVITVIISIFLSRFVLEGLGVEDYGVYKVVGGIIGLMGFITATLRNSSNRFIANALGKGDIDYTVLVFRSVRNITKKIVFILLAALILVGFIFINYVLNIPSDRLLAAKIVYASMIINTAYSLSIAPYSGFLYAKEKIGFLSIVGVVNSVFKLGIAYLITFTQTDNLILYAILLMILSFFNRTVIKVYCIKTEEVVKLAKKKVGEIDKSLNKEIWSFSGWNLLEAIGIVTLREGSVFLVNIFFGVIANAAYGLSTVVNAQMRTFTNSVLNAIKPILYKSYGTKDKVKQHFFTFISSKIGVILLLFIVVPLICEIDFILSIWLTEIPKFTSIFIKLALLISLERQMSYGIIVSMQAFGRIKEIQVITFILQILNFPLIYMAFKLDYPVYGIYVIAMFIESLVLISRLYIVKRYLSLDVLRYIYDVILKPLIIFSISYFAYRYFVNYYGESFSSFILILLINVLVISVYSYSWILNNKERKIVNRGIQTLMIKISK